MSTTHTQTADQPAFSSPAHSHDQHLSPGDISVGVVVGRTVGFFDMFVFGLACVLVFPKVVFPFASEADGILYSFAIFALGFIAQPLGSLFFLPIQRRYGRATKLTISLFMLGCATVGIAFMPAYSELGWATIVWLAALRFAQGFGIGGSWNGLASLLALKAPSNRRGWFASIPQLGAPIGFIVAAGLFAYISSSLSTAEFLAWGWRFPFFTAFAVNVVALFARLRLVVSPEYANELKQRELEPAPIGDVMREQGQSVALGAIAPLASYALFNLVTILHWHGPCCSPSNR